MGKRGIGIIEAKKIIAIGAHPHTAFFGRYDLLNHPLDHPWNGFVAKIGCPELISWGIKPLQGIDTPQPKVIGFIFGNGLQGIGNGMARSVSGAADFFEAMAIIPVQARDGGKPLGVLHGVVYILIRKAIFGTKIHKPISFWRLPLQQGTWEQE